ncbi:MAG: helix-turn-helix transcriptional regulator [Gemmatimonadota bacterium]|nr:helix-turn-helix transcriptional regulator [Gemmatimonadota bacterium]
MRAVHTKRYQALLARLKAARVACGLTQVQVARALGRQQAYVSKCELGERRIDPIDLLDFSVLYRKPLEYFLADSKSRTLRRPR